MSASTLFAIETITYLRLQLMSKDELIFESLCHNRFEKVAKVLAKTPNLG